jgi:fructose-1,6-bisphosphatase/inositol monophosphatase family enzyme
MDFNLGIPLNGHAAGTIMKAIVQRAIDTIRAQRLIFEATDKTGYDGNMDDVVTSADRAAQEVYVRRLKECFPGFGIIAEEAELSIPCSLTSIDAYFTVDPLDGTKAFKRKQSDGIGTMLSLVVNGDIVAAYVGDITTGEIYGYRPGSNKVHRIAEFGIETLVINPDKKLIDQYLLLRKRPEEYCERIRSILAKPEEGGFFKDIEIAGGSIGISMARLWKGEIGGHVLKQNFVTPWDETPIVGISKKLGFVFLEISDDGFRTLNMHPKRTVEKRNSQILVIHESRYPEFVSSFLS